MISIKTIPELHRLMGVKKTIHPLISVCHYDGDASVVEWCESLDNKFILELYQIAMEDDLEGKLNYGRSSYDFQEGSMIFIKPGQVFGGDKSFKSKNRKGWVVTFHPDLIRRSELGTKIDEYTFFSYEVNESLHLSEKEKQLITYLVNIINDECKQNLDRHSINLINSNLKLLLDYCMRFYERQFFSRTILNKDVLSRLEKLLVDYYKQNKQLEFGTPTVKYCGTELHMSPNYLSDLLKRETGKNTIEHIQNFIIEKAKTKLMNKSIGITQIAYELGFESAPYFSKLFKKITGTTPSYYANQAEN